MLDDFRHTIFDFESMEHIISHFINTGETVTISPFGNGHINHTLRVEVVENGAAKKYIFQKINRHVFRQPEAVMENIQTVVEHLSNQDYPLKFLRLTPTRSGHLFFLNEEGEYWRAFPFFENTFAPEKVEREEQAFEAARAFGKFAKALDGIDISKLKTTIPHFHDGLFRLRFFKKTLREATAEKRKEAKTEIEAILRSENLFQEIAKLKLPLRAVHHDTKINNLLFDKKSQKPVAVIDLDTVMPGVVLSDFGDLVRTSVSPVEEDESDLSKIVFRKEIYVALLEGFLSETGDILTKEEKENLSQAGPWLTLMQAVRFLTDYLAGDVYYPVKYEGHNLVRTKCQLRLFDEMRRAFGQLTR